MDLPTAAATAIANPLGYGGREVRQGGRTQHSSATLLPTSAARDGGVPHATAGARGHGSRLSRHSGRSRCARCLQALTYDVRRGPHSIGAHVRDAAAYVCWAFARAYAPEVVAGSVHALACTLLTVACYDREVRGRGGWGATGAQDWRHRGHAVPEGIPGARAKISRRCPPCASSAGRSGQLRAAPRCSRTRGAVLPPSLCARGWCAPSGELPAGGGGGVPGGRGPPGQLPARHRAHDGGRVPRHRQHQQREQGGGRKRFLCAGRATPT